MTLDMRWTCAHCGAEIPDHKRADAEHCSRACKDAAYQAFIKADRRRRMEGRFCVECGTPLGLSQRTTATYCGRKCIKKAARRRARG
jgi:hypothetical protein